MSPAKLPAGARRLLDQLSRGAEAPQFTLSGRTVVVADWTTHPRRLPFHLLYFIIEHRMVGTVAGEEIELRPGSLLWISPLQSHHLWQPPQHPPFAVYFFRFRAGKTTRQRPFHLLVHNAWELRPVLQNLRDELAQKPAFHEPMIRGLLLEVLARSLRRAELAGEAHTLLSPLQQQLLLELVESQPSRRFRPADLAAALRLSPDYFSRLFRHSLGVPPKTWLVHQRTRAAASQLVDTTGSIKEIAHGLGYRDLYLFSRQFKQVMGIGPRDFRRRPVL